MNPKEKIETDLSLLFKNQSDCTTVVLKSYETNSHFLNEIRRLSQRFQVCNTKYRKFWESVINCLCGFLIKKRYQNARELHENYMNEEFDEYKETSEASNPIYIELRYLGKGSSGEVYLIYHIIKETIFAYKMTYQDEQELNERERLNYLNIGKFQYICQYYGYIENN